MVRLHSTPLHGLRTSRYRGGAAVCHPSGRLGISPNVRTSAVTLLCRPSPVFPRFRANGSHRSITTQGPNSSHRVLTLPTIKDGAHGMREGFMPRVVFAYVSPKWTTRSYPF